MNTHLLCCPNKTMPSEDSLDSETINHVYHLLFEGLLLISVFCSPYSPYSFGFFIFFYINVPYKKQQQQKKHANHSLLQVTQCNKLLSRGPATMIVLIINQSLTSQHYFFYLSNFVILIHYLQKLLFYILPSFVLQTMCHLKAMKCSECAICY